ncbi:hypothetical protein CTAYLR_008441 [Chrysophaeum taylorii]|uniref:Methyltransferase domain-containing protein n=1 Tax=Chrysophaeum taylorii TaxID=2483200 RepID=A0AAD7UK00_9STRA|nr:hypothetical protein CTAYLR_008441 [Chrysophaeum taylorii]
MTSFEEWIAALPMEVGDEAGAAITPSAARRLWEARDPTEDAAATVRKHVGKATAAQAVLRGLAARQRPREVSYGLAPFNPTPLTAVSAALDLLRISPADLLYDVGCGDGRVVGEAARRGARCVGVELDRKRADAARANVAAFSNLAEIRCEDASVLDFADATAIFVYLVPRGLRTLKPTLEALRHRARIVAYTFAVPGWVPTATHTLPDLPPLYLYT